MKMNSFLCGQLTGDVGPSITRAEKNDTKVCNILDYGGEASTTADVGPPLVSAFAACKSGGTGDYGMSTFATLCGGTTWALQLDGIIYGTGGLASGNMISVVDSTDFELFSSTSKGAMQGYGYAFHSEGLFVLAKSE